MPTDQAATELHFHALHGVDDGPDTLAESVELVRLAALPTAPAPWWPRPT